MQNPPISVIITTRNEQVHIENCINSIKKQTYPADKIEIIVVDNNSSDKTAEIARLHTPHVFTKGPERSAQRNFGIEKSKGKFILYLDADMMLAENIIKECVTKCEGTELIALYIPERIIGDGFWIKVRDFERGFYNATCIDAVRFVKKETFSRIGGFDENLTGPEDWDFTTRITDIGKTGIITAPIYHNEKSFDLAGYLNKKAYYINSFEKYVQKWGRDNKVIRRQLGIWYRFFGVFLERGGYKRLLRHPHLTICMYFLRIMVGVKAMGQKGGA